jgi:PKD repeat protein
MSAIERIRKIKPLKEAMLSLSAASGIAAKTQAAEQVINALKKLGLYDDKMGDYSDNPNDENYRYADTGYIAGSKKEAAQNHIKQLAKDGVAVKATDIDWDEIESDAVLAEDTITKKNIIGDYSYEELKENGVEPGTAFIIQKVLASVSTTPHWDLIEFVKNSNAGGRAVRTQSQKAAFAKVVEQLGTAKQKQLARKAYVVGIDTLKSRISDKKTLRSLVDELKLIGQEMAGFGVSSKSAGAYEKLMSERDQLLKQARENHKEYYQKSLDVLKEQGIKWPSSVQSAEWLNQNTSDGPYEVNGALIYKTATKIKLWELNEAISEMSLHYYLDAITSDMTTQAWISLGPRFWAVVELTSDSFVKHVNTTFRGKNDDWTLTIPDNKKTEGGAKSKVKKKTTFETMVADNIERKGGREVTIKSTAELKDAFGFRDIQSGTWVLKDKGSAEFHVENAAASMMDLSDIIGIDAKSLAFGGRLALAFGARGNSGARAHYEPVQRVINITKMKGGGSLGHEWWHAIDNILGEVMGADGAVGKGVFLSADFQLLGGSKVGTAFKNLYEAMTTGDYHEYERFKITQENVDLAIMNIDREGKLSPSAQIIKDLGADAAIRKFDEMWSSAYRQRRSKRHDTWCKVAAAYYNQDKVGEFVNLETGPKTSKYKLESMKIDGGRSKSYWATTHEMSARAFQAYLEDSLKGQDRRNDYLSYGADNALYGGQHNAYPEGAERTRINKAFDALFKIIKDEKIFENAAANESMMDSIFGAMEFEEPDLYGDDGQ